MSTHVPMRAQYGAVGDGVGVGRCVVKYLLPCLLHPSLLFALRTIENFRWRYSASPPSHTTFDMSARPGTARPLTARPTTAASRPTTRAGTLTSERQEHSALDNSESAHFAYSLGTADPGIYHHRGAHEYTEQLVEDDDDDEGDDDDDDVFAFAPPGTSSGVLTVPSDTVWRRRSDATLREEPQSRFSTASDAGQASQLYYDDTYGAIYDAEGRMLKSPSANVATQHSAQHSQPMPQTLSKVHYDKKMSGHSASFASTSPSLNGRGYEPFVDDHERSHSTKEAVGMTDAFDHTGMRMTPDHFTRDSVHTSMANTAELHGATDSYDLFKMLDHQNGGTRTVELEYEAEEDSPFPEVRASVSNVDDPTMPTATFRSICLGLILSCIIASAHTLLVIRNPPIQLTTIVVQLLVHPLGKLMAATLPYRVFRLPGWMGGFTFSFNPGLWNIKEHTAVTIITSFAVDMPYPLAYLLTHSLSRYWGDTSSMLFSFLFLCAPQLLGLALSGFLHEILIRPASMVWPQNLATATILNTLHAEDEPGDGTMTRIRYFTIVSGAAFVAYFFPGYLFMALSYLNWICWIWPDNVPVNTVFGVAGGLGASVLTLDWTQITLIGNPLISPWWSQVNVFSGFVVACWIIAPALYFTNTWSTAYLPIISAATYDRHARVYDVQRVSLDRQSLDREGYESYSPIYMSAGLIVTYAAGFALLTATIIHTALHHGKSLWWTFRYGSVEEDDVHSKLMRRYALVPHWWSALLLLFSFVLCIVLAVCYDTKLPVWALALSILIPAVYLIPFGLIFAMSSLSLTVNLIAELAAAYLMPHNAVAIMTFKTLSQHVMNSALSLLQNQKLGHYMKLPPRQLFFLQALAIVTTSVVQAVTKSWMVSNVPDLCSPTQKDRFTCNSVQVFYSASVIWGMIGPQRTFGLGSIYHPLYYGLIVGIVAPCIVWWLSTKFRRSKFAFKYWSTPIIFAGMQWTPPAQGINFSAYFAVACLVNHMRRKAFGWWQRYNFVTACALDFGTILSSLFIFFALQMPKNGSLTINWWGNEVFTQTADYQRRPLMQAPKDGFGPLPKF